MLKGDNMNEAKTMRYGTRLHKHVYTYGMRLRGFSIGCQPMNGFIRRMDDDSRRYHDLLIYNRKLTDSELTDYELDYLGEAN